MQMPSKRSINTHRLETRSLSIIAIMNIITTTPVFSDPTAKSQGKICSTINFILSPLSFK